MGTWIHVLRDARWFGRERAVAYGVITAIAFAPTVVWNFLRAMRLGSDFLTHYTASHYVLQGAPQLAYDWAAEQLYQTTTLGRPDWVPFFYPPPLLPFISWVALVPYPVAWWLWGAVGYAVWLLLARRLSPGAFWPVAAFPGAVVALWHAQTGLLTAALWVGAALAFPRRPILAGALLGALVIKPHLALLVPLAFLIGRDWKAFIGAGLSAVGLLLASWALYGGETMVAFVRSLELTRYFMSGSDLMTMVRMTTVFASVMRFAGGDAATIAQAVCSLVAAGAVIRAWSRPIDPNAKMAVLAAATPLATPYLFSYDLPLLIIPICWVANTAMRDGWRPWERAGLAFLYWSPLFGRAVAEKWGWNPTWIALLALLAVVVTRTEADRFPRRRILAEAGAVG